MYHRNKLLQKRINGIIPIPRDSMFLQQTKQIELNHHIQTQSQIKRRSLITLKLNIKFLTRLINQIYKLNTEKSESFAHSLLFYTKIIIDPNTNDKQFRRLIIFINDQYQFIDSPQSLGLLVGNMILIRLENPSMRKEISNSIEKLYIFTEKDRTFCDFSKIAYFQIIDMLMNFSQSYPPAVTYVGWRHFERVQVLFEDFYVSKERTFKQVWTEFKFNQEKYEHQVAMLIHKLTKIHAKDQQEKSNQLFSFLFLLKFLLSQQKFTDFKLSQILTKSIKSIVNKLCYVQINVNFFHMNWFLMLCKLVAQEKEFFGDTWLKVGLGLSVARVFFQANRTKYSNNIVEEFKEMTTNQSIFSDFQTNQKDPLSQTNPLKILTQNPSQLLSYGSKFNQRRKASSQSIYRYLSQKSQQRSYIPEHKLSITMMTHRSQILKYTEEKIQKQQYLSLLLSLEDIYNMFEGKIKELTGAIVSDMRHEKLRDLQTFYVAAYMKILLALRSQQNSLYNEGFMSDDFISHFCYQIISRFSQQVITDINIDSLYNTLYLEYSISETIFFDIDNERFGLRELFEILSQREVLMGSSVCLYEIEMLRRYYNLVCNGSIERGIVKNDKKLPIQKFVERILQKRQLLEKKRKDASESHRIREENRQTSRSQNYRQERGQQKWDQQQKQQYQQQSNNGNQPQRISTKSQPLQIDEYALQFSLTSRLQFSPPQMIPFYFIKSEILRMLDNYLKYYPIKPLDERKQFYDIFCCLVIVVDNQEFLMDMYANVLFKVLSDSKGELVMREYQRLAMVRMLHCEKYQRNFKHTQLARGEIICVFQKLRKIEIKRNRQLSKTLFPSSSTNPSTGRHKFSLANPSSASQPSSKVYTHYFYQLFKSPLKQLISYGKQLFGIKKFKQAIFVLEIVREKMNDKLEQINDEVMRGERREIGREQRSLLIERKQMERMMAQCDLLLSDCYSTLTKQFYSLHQYINQKCIFDRMKNDSQFMFYLRQKRCYMNINKEKTVLPHNNPHTKSSLISTITQLITTHYTQITSKLQQQVAILVNNPSSTADMIIQEETFRSICYSTIYKYCVERINTIGTKDDLKLFYNNLLLGGVVYKWYQEKYIELMEKVIRKANDICDSFEMNNNSAMRQLFQDEFPRVNQSQLQQQNYQNHQKQQFPNPQSYTQLIPSFYHSITSKIDKFSLINMINKIQLVNHVYNFETIRALNQSLLETKQEGVIFYYLERYYNGIDKYEDMGLLDLELLEKYHFQKENYHHVKAITKHMNKEYQNQTFGPMEKYFPNWPQIYGYDLISKIYDLNSKQNPQRYWSDIANIIEKQKYLVVDGVKFSFIKLQNPNLVKNIETNSPQVFTKLSHQLDAKIKQYFNLLRIIFTKLQLSRSERSLLIFQLMHLLYERFFIPTLTKQQVHVDFFLYYLRFLCEKINTKYFHNREGKTKRNDLIVFLLRFQQYVKNHSLYMLRSLDPEPNTEKNSILRDILVPILINNVVENVWILTYLKYYQKKMPQGKQMIKKSQEKKSDNKKKDNNQMITKYIFPQDSQINQLHNAAIQQVYRAVSTKLDNMIYSQLVSIPIMFIQWLEKTVMERIDEPNKPVEMLYFAKQQNIQKQKDQINKKILISKFRIPYPFDHRLYIKNVSDIRLSIYEGKSMPCFVSFNCGLYSDIEGDNNKYIKKASPPQLQSNTSSSTNFTIQKHILLKNNFTHSDHRIETNTANFYKQIGLLDDETTYGILNLTKYILIIEKICAPHKSLRDLIGQSCCVNYDEVNVMRNKYMMQLRKQYGNEKHLIQPKWVDNCHNLTTISKDKFPSKPSIFNYFYLKSIQNHKSINQWWNYIQNYVRTLAYWSYACWITKLGDRHLTNILVSDKGKFIHIDYQYNFGYGLLLPCPEWMPFRLTELMVSPLGTFKEKGLFLAYFVNIAKIFNPNQERIWKALCHFSPIQRSIIQQTSKFQTVTTVNTIEQKCQKIIDLSKDNSLLRLMYSGWSPEF